MVDSKLMKKRIDSDLRFLKGWIKKPRSVGSIKPTSPAAAKVMIAEIPANSDLPLLELGPGTGPITKAMLETGIEPNKIFSVEFDKEFFRHLTQTFKGVTFIEGDAFNLEETLAGLGEIKFSAVLSSIPLLNFPREMRQKLVLDCLSRMPAGSPFIQLCYGPKPPIPSKPELYSLRSTKWVLNNIPPARFWVYSSNNDN